MRFLEYIELNPKVSLEKGKEYPFIEMNNVSTQYRDPEFIDIKEFDSGVRFQDGDTVIARITPCLQNGKRFYCKNIGSGFGSTEYLVFRSKDTNIVDSLFLYYFMNTDFIRKSMINSMTGATGRQRVNNDVFNTIDIKFPEIKTQCRIADILSAYDDLIENNQKQIKLLEEAAQRLYKEWFVDLRFPGYEQTKIIDGVPEGWEIVCLKAYCDIKSGYAFKSKDWNKSGCGVIKIKDISNNFVDYSDCDFVPKDIAEKATNYYLNQGDLVIAMTGATIGKIGICTKEGYYANQRVGKVFLGNKPKEKLPYAYCILSQKSTMDFILNNSSASSAQPNISGDKICDIKIVYNEVYVMRFNKKMKSVFEKMILLKEQNKMLSVIRDNLLPKLMSGEIVV